MPTTFTIKKTLEPTQLIITESGEYHVELVDPGAEVTTVGLFSQSGKEKLDIQLIIHHMAPHTRANTTLKGVARDQAQIRFAGRIIIEKDCGDSHSFLTERILLLSDQTKAEAVPDLEIKTDDVSCSHAASVSRIPPEQIFYLMSRGLPQRAAEELIVEGFLDPHQS